MFLSDIDTSVVENLEVPMKVVAIVVHKGYNSFADFDVAVLKLEKPISFDTYIRPIKLPEIGKWPQFPDQCIITGFGRISGDKLNINFLYQ